LINYFTRGFCVKSCGDVGLSSCWILGRWRHLYHQQEVCNQ